MTVAYIYIRASYFLIKQKINNSKKNYIKFAIPVAKHTAEYVSKCYLEEILSVWDFIKGFYRYEYVFWRLNKNYFKNFANFILRFHSLSRKLRVQRREIDITHNQNNLASKVKGT
jgi:hypothetical protein